MTSREIFKAVLDFRNPPRIALTQPAPYPNDVVGGGRKLPEGAIRELPPQGNEVRRWLDEWGCTWATLTKFDKGEVVEPAIADWSQLDGYVPPDLGRPEQYAELAKIFAADKEHFRIAWLPGFTFNVARYIRRMDNYFADLVCERENVDRLNALVRNELLKAIDRCADAGADAIMFPEDWGMQDRLMISPAMWREIFKPEFVALAQRAHQRGLYVIMHSCGKITEIIEDLIEAGINCLQFDQPRLHGIENLSRRFGGRVAFWCPVDIQQTLQTRDRELIRQEAKLLIDQLGRFDGGFIGGYYWGCEAIGISPEIQAIASQAFVEFGTYSK
jgi:hypothetical protein